MLTQGLRLPARSNKGLFLTEETRKRPYRRVLPVYTPPRGGAQALNPLGGSERKTSATIYGKQPRQ